MTMLRTTALTPPRKLSQLVGAENAAHEAIAPTFDQRVDPSNPDDIGANPPNHYPTKPCASRIRRFISRTASLSPTKTARETIA